MRGVANVIQSVLPAERRAGEGRGREGRRLCGVEGAEPRNQDSSRERGWKLQGGDANLLPAASRSVPEGQVRLIINIGFKFNISLKLICNFLFN